MGSIQATKHPDTAIDEGYFVGTNSGPLGMPTGEIPATGRTVRLRACDFATVEDGRATSHRIYFDQMEILQQLGLARQNRQDVTPQQRRRRQDAM